MRGLLPVDVVVGQPLILVRELSGKVLGHAAHPDRADALNARALNGVECVPRGALIRCERRMQFGIVRRDHEGDRIGMPADDRHFLARHARLGCGSRAVLPSKPGASEPNVTFMDLFAASERVASVTARLNGASGSGLFFTPFGIANTLFPKKPFHPSPLPKGRGSMPRPSLQGERLFRGSSLPSGRETE